MRCRQIREAAVPQAGRHELRLQNEISHDVPTESIPSYQHTEKAYETDLEPLLPAKVGDEGE